MIAVGQFDNQNPVTQLVRLGQPFRYSCPKHGPSYGVSFTWEGLNSVQFKRSASRAISPTGDLFIMYVTEEDVNEINNVLKGIRCKMSAANRYEESGPLTVDSQGNLVFIFRSCLVGTFMLF